MVSCFLKLESETVFTRFFQKKMRGTIGIIFCYKFKPKADNEKFIKTKIEALMMEANLF